MTASGVNLGTLVPKSQGWEQNAVRLRGSLGFLIDWLAITRAIRGFQVHRGIREEFNTLGRAAHSELAVRIKPIDVLDLALILNF